MAFYGLATQVAGPSNKAVAGSYPTRIGLYIFQTDKDDAQTLADLMRPSYNLADVGAFYVAHFIVYLDGRVEQAYDTDVKLVSWPEKGGEENVWIAVSGLAADDPPQVQWAALLGLVRWLYSVVAPNTVIEHKLNVRGDIQVEEP